APPSATGRGAGTTRRTCSRASRRCCGSVRRSRRSTRGSRSSSGRLRGRPRASKCRLEGGGEARGKARVPPLADPQDSPRRKKQKARRAKQLEAWREKNPKKEEAKK